jgi:DNA-binding transcriptional regulator YiaG
MPKPSSLKALLERPVPAGSVVPDPSAIQVDLLLRRTGAMAQPVSLARALTRQGIGLRKAHDVLNRLADGQSVPVRLATTGELETFRTELATLGVEARPCRVPDTIDVRRLRERLGLTQLEFAIRFGLDPDAVQNWEQGRTRPDRNARVLLRVIETAPAAVETAIS